MTTTIHWDGTLTALSSIVHGGKLLGTTRMLRRETTVGPDGEHVQIPVISGNSFRAILRQTAEDLTRDVLDYAETLPHAAAVTLRGGGRLAKSAREPLTGRRRHEIRNLLPLLSIFGGAGGATIFQGCLKVGKVTPHLYETAHLLDPSMCLTAAIAATQQETYTRLDHENSRDVDQISAGPDSEASAQMLFNVETFPAGTTFGTWLRLERATDLEVAFFRDVIEAFRATAFLGGRTAIGHGVVRADFTETLMRGIAGPTDWQEHLRDNRAEILTALEQLT